MFLLRNQNNYPLIIPLSWGLGILKNVIIFRENKAWHDTGNVVPYFLLKWNKKNKLLTATVIHTTVKGNLSRQLLNGTDM